jgi:transcriptional regulator with XRE-family HTH domain
MTSRIALRRNELSKYMGLKGIHTQAKLAELMGVSESTVYRTLAGQMAPGEKFIAGLLRTFAPHCTFEDLFECVDAPAA